MIERLRYWYESDSRPAHRFRYGLLAFDILTVVFVVASSFARDIHGLPGTAAIIAGYNKKYGKKWSTFGPPSYVSVQVAASAYKAACADGTASRAEIMKNIRAVKIPHSILGITISFDKHGDVPAAKFYVSQIQSDGSHKLVG